MSWIWGEINSSTEGFGPARGLVLSVSSDLRHLLKIGSNLGISLIDFSDEYENIEFCFSSMNLRSEIWSSGQLALDSTLFRKKMAFDLRK